MRQRERVKSAGERMANALRACNERRSRDLAGLSKLMDTLSHKSVLARGFALVRDGGEAGPPIRSAAAISPGQGLTLQFADGCVAGRPPMAAGRAAGGRQPRRRTRARAAREGGRALVRSARGRRAGLALLGRPSLAVHDLARLRF